MSEQTSFLERAATKSADKVHAANIFKAVTSFEQAHIQTKQNQFHDWQDARERAAEIKDDVLNRLPDLLETFEKNISARGTKVLWAEDADEARRHFMEIARKHKARKIVKAKSMATEEIELNELLESEGLDVIESDLGELIVQLGREKPYHIIAPAIHKTKEEIAQLFHEKLDAPLTDSPEELTMVARAHLRKIYVTADIGVSGANFLIADEGAIEMTENEGNGRLSMSCPPVHVVICGIEKVLPRMTDLAFFLPLLATGATGQQISCYNSIVRGPRQPGETDGPEHMYVILLDNGRTNLYANEAVRRSLRCIRCGACLNTCPVYRTVGGHAYNTPYQGPIGSVISPHLQGLKDWNHLSFASSLCASCSDICPVNIDLHHLLLENRKQAVEQKSAGKAWSVMMKIWAYAMSDRLRLNRLRVLGEFGEKLTPLFIKREKRRRIPKLANKTFQQWWRENEES